MANEREPDAWLAPFPDVMGREARRMWSAILSVPRAAGARRTQEPAADSGSSEPAWARPIAALHRRHSLEGRSRRAASAAPSR